MPLTTLTRQVFVGWRFNEPSPQLLTAHAQLLTGCRSHTLQPLSSEFQYEHGAFLYEPSKNAPMPLWRIPSCQPLAGAAADTSDSVVSLNDQV